MWNHNSMVKQIKDTVCRTSLKLKSIEHYRPDVFCEANGKKVVIEVETYAQPDKLTQDIIFSYILQIDKLIIVLSNKGKEGESRISDASSLRHQLIEHFPKLSEMKVKFLCIERPDDIKEVVKAINNC